MRDNRGRYYFLILIFTLACPVVLFSEDIFTHNKMGIKHVSCGDFPKAEEEFLNSLAIDKTNDTANDSLGAFQDLNKGIISEEYNTP